MNVTIKELQATRLAVIEHRGSPSKIAVSINKLRSWSKAQPIYLNPKPGDAIKGG